MKQIIKFKSSKEHYRADACVIWCFDDRFSILLEETKKKLHLKKIDQVEIAGGAKGLADGGKDADYILDQINKSIKLHHTPLVVLMVHKDCGAYGKLDLEDEDKFFSDQLQKAKKNIFNYLKNNGHNTAIKTFLADFDGLSDVE